MRGRSPWSKDRHRDTLAGGQRRTFYILTGGSRNASAEVKAAIAALRPAVSVAAPGAREVDAALQAPWDDFEGAFVCQTAVGIGADAIVTRDAKDFSQPPVPIVSPADFLRQLG